MDAFRCRKAGRLGEVEFVCATPSLIALLEVQLRSSEFICSPQGLFALHNNPGLFISNRAKLSVFHT